jgi:glycosyltransferase involved in cell wall biosynthesis
MMQFIKENGLADSVKFLGQLDDAALIAEYAECSLMLVSSVLETAPMVILQAMAAGVPVVSTDAGGIRYLVDHGTSGAVVATGDDAGLARESIAILESPSLRDDFGQKARAIAVARLRAADIAIRTQDIYRAALRTAD